MDCSWDYEGNSACDGGNYDGALDYLIDVGGAVLDTDYEYLGQDGWCLDRNHSDTHTTNLTKFKVRLLCHRLNPLCDTACGIMCVYRGVTPRAAGAAQEVPNSSCQTARSCRW